MCRPPDVLSQLTSSDNRRDIQSNQNFGSGLEFNLDNFGNNGLEWEDTNEDLLGEENGWEWQLQQQQMQANNMPSHHFIQQQMIPPMDFQSLQCQNFGPSMAKQPRTNGPNVFRSGSVLQANQFAIPENTPWKMMAETRTLNPMPWTSSVPLAPPRVPFSSSIASGQCSSMMAGPSLGHDSQLTQGSSPAMWSKMEMVEPVEQWMKPTPRQSLNNTLVQSQISDIISNNKIVNLEKGAVEVSEALDETANEEDDATMQKKIRRMLSNRASAKRSRQRRQERLGELEIQTAKLRVDNAAVAKKYNEAMEQVHNYQKENDELRHELMAVRSEMENMRGLKRGLDGSSKQESGKTSAHSAAHGGSTPVKDEPFNEAHSHDRNSKKNYSNFVTGLTSGMTSHPTQKASPASGLTRDWGESNNEVKPIAKDLEIATDEWFESLVQSLDE